MNLECSLVGWWVGLEGGNLFEKTFSANLWCSFFFFFLFLFLTGPVCFPQSVCFGYYQIPEGLESGSYLPEHNCNDNLWEPCTHDHVWKDQWLHCLIPKENLSGVNQTGTPTAKENAPMLTCFYMSNILILCSVLLELIWECEAAHVKRDKWEAGAMRGCGWVVSNQLHSWLPMGWVHFFFFFSLENYRIPGKVSYDFFFLLHSFLKRLFYMIHTLKPGLCWVEYILSIRGLFLPTVSWNLADGKYIIVDDYHIGRGMWYLFCLFSIWTCAFSELCFHRQNSVDISIFVLNLIIGLCGIFKQ